MGLDASLVGKKLTPFTTVVGPRATMGYAAAIGDASPRYLDDRLETIVAPPMFAVALSWPVLGDIQRYADFPLPPEVAMAVHAREQLRFERLLRPGERVTIRGEIAALVPQRAGALVVFTLPVFDEADALVHTEHLGALLRGATLDDGGAGEERVPKLSTSDFSTPVWQQPIPTSPLLAHVYDACTEIVFGIHTSPRMAEALGLPGIILQGTATLALAVRENPQSRGAGGARAGARHRLPLRRLRPPGRDNPGAPPRAPPTTGWHRATLRGPQRARTPCPRGRLPPARREVRAMT